MESELVIYNSLSRKKERFIPLLPGKVGMYVCGPTVYGDPHLGHARSAITFDTVYRYLTYLGYQVRYVRNITDVGHLEDEQAEQGEDKILKRARLEALEPMEVAQRYTNSYRKAMRSLNVTEPSIEPVASGHILEQIQIIKEILANGFAYEVEGSVYFDLHAYTHIYPYGQLTGRNIEEARNGSRNLSNQQEKKHPADFALWKKAGPEHLMKWESPWSWGFPGWHIECTAMSTKYLGLPFDIHGGGLDLKFPHHESEIVQSYAAFHQAPVNYWMHNNLVTLEGQKMAKSKGNFITLQELFSGDHFLLEKAYSPMTLRVLMLLAHYSSPLDFSNQALKAAESVYKKLMNGLALLPQLRSNEDQGSNEIDQEILTLCQRCKQEMDHDFNTASTISVLLELNSWMNKISKNDQLRPALATVEQLKNTYHAYVTNVLGLLPESQADERLASILDILINLRNKARQEKNYSLSDQIRAELANQGIQLLDSSLGEVQIKWE
ncbi:cysteine--tRNA ligase [Siphonobacter sp. SORGH_AS_1065]|uniref:cysteine--tRNA ligase n=1 Tax=Siphonobacter sp. SORGH_AS_1065 TaxID=3041795 RepID=UPI00278AE8E8|nr:cysteine--tRNA ligase [Siphonobacter sp. SORGH_AS_1065]MDQ1090295.1 cysteinyl-tRNA synthetase [Siphonobacter sp. SORGH_AS_1065]